MPFVPLSEAGEDPFRVPAPVQRTRDERALELKRGERELPQANAALEREIANDEARLGVPRSEPLVKPSTSQGFVPLEGFSQQGFTPVEASTLDVLKSAPAQMAGGLEAGLASTRQALLADTQAQLDQTLQGSTISPSGARIPQSTLDRQFARRQALTPQIEQAGRESAIAQKGLELVTPEGLSDVQKAIVSVFRSAPTTIAGMAIGGINPVAGMAVAGGGGMMMQGGETYRTAREKGATHEAAMTAGGIDALLEGLGEAVGVKVATLRKLGLLPRIAATVTTQAGQEAGTQLAQDLNASLSYNPDVTLGEAMNNAKIAAMAGAMGGSVYGGIAHIAEGSPASINAREVARAIDEAQPRGFTPIEAEKEALRLLDPKVSGQAAETPQDRFARTLTSGSAADAAAMADQLQPAEAVKLGKRLFDEGVIDSKKFADFRRQLIMKAATSIESPELAEAKAQTKLAEAAVTGGETYVPTTEELAELERARTTTSILDLPPDTPLAQWARSILDGSGGKVLVNRQLNSGLTAEEFALAEYKRGALQQSQGLYPYAPMESQLDAVWADRPVKGAWTREGRRDITTAHMQLSPGRVAIVGLPDNEAAVVGANVEEWMKRYAPGMKLVLEVGNQDPRSLGFAEHWGKDTYYNSITSQPEENQLNTMSHEFGHALGHYLLGRSTPAVRRAVMQAWGRDAQRFSKGSYKDFQLKGMGARNDPLRQTLSMQEGMERNPAIFRDYLLNFDEWLAHQMERASANNYDGMSRSIHGFFKKYAALIKSWFTHYGETFAPNQTYSNWLEYHRRRTAEQWLEKERFAEVDAALRQIGIEDLTRVELAGVDRQLARGLATANQQLRDDVMSQPPAVRNRIAVAMQRLGEEETEMLIPDEEGMQPDALQLLDDLQDSVVAGQKPNELVRALPMRVEMQWPSTLTGANISRTVKALGPSPKDTSHYRGDLDRFTWMSKIFNSLQTIGERNPHIVPLGEYVRLTRQWVKTKMEWISRADLRFREWHRLSTKDRDILANYLFDQTKGGVPLNLQDIATRTQYPMSDKAVELSTKITQDFSDFIGQVEQALAASATQRLAGNPVALVQEMLRLRQQFAQLKQKPYFPLMRFGKYLVLAKATANVRIGSRQFKQGDTVHFEAFDTETEAKLAASQLRARMPQSVSTKLDEASEDARAFMGMPEPLLDALKSDPSINLDPKQQKALDEYLYKIAPGQSFTKRLLPRKNIPGHSEDAMRSYANYFFHGASHLARIQFATPMANQLSNMKITAEGIQFDSRKRRNLSNYMNAHFDHLMNPKSDWAALRSGIAIAYLGGMLSTALVNLTQVPMVTYPHLAAKYGDAKAINELRKAYMDAMAAFRSTRSQSQEEQDVLLKWSQGVTLTADEQKIVKKLTKLAPDEQAMLLQGQTEAWLEESFAMELAAASEGGWLSRLRATSALGYRARQFAHWSMVPFEIGERINRRVTALAAYRLARQAGSGHGGAVESARESVRRSQFEYAKWDRPTLLRGKRGVLLMFMQYQLSMLRYAFGGDPGWWRWWLMMLAMVGPMGLPFAEDIKNLMTWMLSGDNKRVNAGYSMKKASEELGEILQVSPELLLHGVTRNIGYGSLAFDLSGSLGMGHVVPGAELLGQTAGFEQSVTRGLGMTASTGLVLRMAQAAVQHDPDTLRRLERGMPFRIVQRALGATRMAIRGAAENMAGADVTTFKSDDPWELAELAGYAVGFQPSSLEQGRPERGEPGRAELRLQQDFANFYRVRREMLLKTYDEEREHGNDKGVDMAMDAIRRYNDEVPVGQLRITSRQLRESVKRREATRSKVESGHAPSRSDEMIYRAVKDRDL